MKISYVLARPDIQVVACGGKPVQCIAMI